MSRLLDNLRVWTGAAAPALPTQDHAQRRSRGVMTGAASAFVARVLTLLVGIALVPLTVNYLGSERYGIWMTISASLALLSFVDFGLEDSLTNALGIAYGREEHERARRYVSSTFAALCVVAVVLLATTSVLLPPISRFLFPRSDALLMRGEIAPALAIAFCFFALRFPLLITGRVLAAYQENALANLWSILGSIANLTGVLAVIWFRGGLPWLVVGASGPGFLISIASAFWLFGIRRPWLRPNLGAFDFTALKQLFASGWKFFVIGAAWLINTETDTVIIAHFLGPALVTPFNVTFQLFTVTIVTQKLVMPSLWPAYTEAYARHDFDWIRRAYRSNARLSFISTGIVVIIFVALGRQIIRIWAGPAAVPPFSLLVWMGLWNLLLAQLYAFGCLLNGLERLRVRLICSPITAALNIALSVLLVRRFGISGVTAATVLAFLIGDYLPVRRQIRALFEEFRAREEGLRVEEVSAV